MPRISQLPVYKRSEITAQQTFDFTTPNLRPAARPVDQYIQPAMDSRALELASFFNVMEHNLRTYAGLQQSNIERNQQQARADAAKDFASGKAPDTSNKPKTFLNQGWGYDQAYATSYGEAQGLKFRNEYKQALKNNNYFYDSTDPDTDKQQVWDELFAKYFGTVDDDFIFTGASAQIEEAKIEGDLAIEQSKYLKAKEIHVNSVQEILNDTIRQYLEGDVQNPVGLRDVTNNQYETTVKPVGFIGQDEWDNQTLDALGTAALTIIDEKEITHDGKTVYKYTTTEAAKKALKAIETMKLSGMYDEKDAAGNYKFRDKVNTYQRAILNAIELREKEDEKELQETSMNNFISLFRKINKGEDISAEAGKLLDSGVLTEDHYLKIIESNRIGRSYEWEIIEDYDYTLQLELDVRMGRKGVSQILSDHRNKKIKVKTADELLTIALAVEEEKKKPKTDKELIDSQRNFLYRYFTPNNMSLNGNQKRARAIREYDIRIRDGEDPYVVADDIVSRYKNSIDEYPQTIYESEEATKEAYRKGKITKQEFVREMQIFEARKYAGQTIGPPTKKGK